MTETCVYEERMTAIHLLRSGQSPTEVIKELSRSLSWVYKWRQRFFVQQSWEDLKARSRAPKRKPRKLPDEVRQAIRQARSELEEEATQPGHLGYIGAHAIRARLKKKGCRELPSLSSIERTISAAGMTRPPKPEVPAVFYPHLQPIQPHQLVQVDIVPHYLPGGACISCFNAIDVYSRYPTGQQLPTKRSLDAFNFMLQMWKELGLPDYTQVDNESCFSGGFTHPGVLGKVLRLALYVGTELVFSPVRHPESNGYVERFHQDYNGNVWDKLELADLQAVQHHSSPFFELYRHSEHHSALNGHSPEEVHGSQPLRPLPETLVLPAKLPVTAGRVHFIRLVNPDKKIVILNLDWDVPAARPAQGVWATLEFASQGAKLRIYDTAPDALKRKCLAEHPFPLKEPVVPLRVEFQKPIPVPVSWFSLAADLFRLALKTRLPAWISTML